MKQCRLGLALDSIQALPFIGLPRWLSGKASSCQCRRCKRRRFDPGVGKIPWRRKWQPTPVFLSGKSHGQRSLAQNPLAMQETCVRSLGWEDSPGEGNGNPLQYSDLENSMDCTVHGVAKSQTRLSDFHLTSFQTVYLFPHSTGPRIHSSDRAV